MPTLACSYIKKKKREEKKTLFLFAACYLPPPPRPSRHLPYYPAIASLPAARYHGPIKFSYLLVEDGFAE